MASAARGTRGCAVTRPDTPYELGRLDAERGLPLGELRRFDDPAAQQEYQRGLDEHARYYVVFHLDLNGGTGRWIQHGPLWWNTAVGERVELLQLLGPDVHIDEIRIIPAHEIEVR